MLQVDKVDARRSRRRILRDISFTIDTGAVALVGPNGAGKTTLMRTLVTLQRPASGRITLLGHDTTSRPGRKLARTVVGYQAQGAEAATSMTVQESIEYAAWLKAIPAKDRTAAVALAMSRMRVTGLRRRPARKLSGGEFKRLLIAQAIVHQPRLLVLDEPTAALDPIERIALLELLNELKSNTTILVSTHNTADIATLCDRIILLANGQTLFDGEIQAFAGVGSDAADLSSRLDSAYAKSIASSAP